MDECVMETHMCGSNGKCENRKGSYNCRCISGYRAEQYGLKDKKCTGTLGHTSSRCHEFDAEVAIG